MSRNRIAINDQDEHEFGLKMLRPVLSHKVTHLGAAEKVARSEADRNKTTVKENSQNKQEGAEIVS